MAHPYDNTPVGAPGFPDGVRLGAPDLAASLGAGLLDAAVGVILLDDAGWVRFANRRFEGALGVEGLTGRRLSERVEGAVLPGGTVEAATASLRGPGGQTRDVVWTRNASGGWLGVLAGAPREALAREAASHERDELTGLGNRAYLRTALRAWKEALRPEQGDLVVLNLDLDHFVRAQEVLDQEGCEALLKRAAQRLRQVTRSTDVVARLDGDTFAVLLPASDGHAAANELAGRITDVLSRPFVVKGAQIAIGATIGLAALSQSDGTIDDMLRLAAMAMQRAREGGHGRAQWFDESMTDKMRRRHLIETGLRRALLLDEFEAHYQAQFDLESGEISGFEALIRWRHPDEGLIPPNAFIPVAEEVGLMPEIGAWMLHEACEAAARWDERLRVAVNVSPSQFVRSDFVDVVRSALASSGLAPRRLELELTEEVLVSEAEQTLETMRRLRACGVSLALDDFGVGYSSLNYLRQFPFDKIKVDQSFVRGPNADRTSMQIIGAVAELGEALGMTVLAEGVETKRQLEDLRERGCDGAQGYLFSKPIPGSEVAPFIVNFAAPAPGNGEEEAKETGE